MTAAKETEPKDDEWHLGSSLQCRRIFEGRALVRVHPPSPVLLREMCELSLAYSKTIIG